VPPVAVEGGVAEVVSGLVRRGVEAELDVHVAFLRDGPAAARLRSESARLHVLHAGRLRSPVGFARTVVALTRIALDVRPDAIIAVEPSAFLYVRSVAWCIGLPALWQQHSVPSKRSVIDRIVGALPARAALVNSAFVAEQQRRLTRSPVIVVRPGANLDRMRDGDGSSIRSAHGIPATAPLIGIVGRLQAWKGQDLFLQAAATIAQAFPEARFAVVGGAEMGWEEGDYPARLHSLARGGALKGRVTFAGQTDKTADWYAAMDVAVHASDHEPYGLVLCEAMAAGCAVVAADEGGPREIVEDRVTGRLVRRSAHDIASEVTSLLRDSALRRRLGVAAARQADPDFGDLRMAQDFAVAVRRASLDGSGRSIGVKPTPRVLFVAPVAIAGGAGEVLLALLTQADLAGIEPHVVLLRDGPLHDRLRRTGVPLEVLSAGRVRDIRDLLTTALRLRAVMRRVRPDAVCATEPSGHLYSAVPAAVAGIPAVWRQPQRPSARSPVDRVASLLPARCVIVASDFVADEQRRLRRRSVRILRPGIDRTRFDDADGLATRAAHRIPPAAKLVMSIGRLQPWKGQDVFLRAAALVANRHPQVHFAVVGGAEMGWEQASYPAFLRALADDLGIADRTTFAGHTDGVAGWYAATDILVHTSDHEPFGLVIPEAMLMGCAVVSVAQGGPRETVSHGQTGILVPNRTPEAFASAIDNLLSDEELRSRVARAGCAAAESRWTAERMAEDFGRLIHDVVGA